MEEVYGRSAVTHGYNKKGDGTLMVQGSDWRNPQSNHTNSPTKGGAKREAENSRDMKFQNLQSSILSNQDGAGIPVYNKDIDKAAGSSNANWTSSQGQKLVNKGSTKIDTYKKVQQQQNSQVFDLPEYNEHVPMKKKRLDVNNVNDKKRQQDHMYSDILGNNTGRGIPQKEKGDSKPGVQGWQTPDVKDSGKASGGYNAGYQKQD